MQLNLAAAKRVAGSIGFPSKMPGTSYGISAFDCKTGGKLAKIEGSVCFDCYAMKGNYIYPSVKKSHHNRQANLESPHWVPAMVKLISWSQQRGKDKHGAPIDLGFHRWHDSGDIQSVDHLAKICAVAAATPTIKHWLPTREIGFLHAFLKSGGIVPSNLTVRVSATMVDGPATKTWPTTSGVHQDKPAVGHACPAPAQSNACGTCRACWSRDVTHVSYHKH